MQAEYLHSWVVGIILENQLVGIILKLFVRLQVVGVLQLEVFQRTELPVSFKLPGPMFRLWLAQRLPGRRPEKCGDRLVNCLRQLRILFADSMNVF